jgi:hypothetical protein
MEQKNLHDLIGVTRGTLSSQIANPDVERAAAAVRAIQTPLPLFICPSDSGFNGKGLVHDERAFIEGLGFRDAAQKLGLANPLVSVSSYIGVSGHRDSYSIQGVSNDPNAPGRNTGVFYENSKVKDKDVSDGTSNTFLVGERNSEDCRSGTWVGVCGPTDSGPLGPASVLGHSRPKLNIHEPNPNAQQLGGSPWPHCTGCGEGFSSLHPNGAQFVLCDGAVRWVSNTINHRWWPDNQYPNCNYQGTVNDSKYGGDGSPQSTGNGTYQRLMTRNDKLGIPDY